MPTAGSPRDRDRRRARDETDRRRPSGFWAKKSPLIVGLDCLRAEGIEPTTYGLRVPSAYPNRSILLKNLSRIDLIWQQVAPYLAPRIFRPILTRRLFFDDLELPDRAVLHRLAALPPSDSAGRRADAKATRGREACASGLLCDAGDEAGAWLSEVDVLRVERETKRPSAHPAVDHQ
jgi:hypothetical protein